MYRWFLALRYLLTRPINLLGMGGITLGVWALIVVVSIFSGFIKVATEHVRSAGADVSVLALPEGTTWAVMQKLLAADTNVATCAPRLLQGGIIQKKGVVPGPQPLLGRSALQGGDGPFLTVLGVDPELEAQVTGFSSWLAGDIPPDLRVREPANPLAPVGDLPAMLLGRERMVASGLRPGDHLMLTTGKRIEARGGPDKLEPVTEEFVIAGAFKTLHAGFDGNNAFVLRAALQRILQPEVPDAVREVAVKLKDDALVTETADRLGRLIRRELHVVNEGTPVAWSWRRREGNLISGVEQQRVLMKMVLIIIMVLAAFLMVATLSMMVTEKTGDIGILTAIGGTPLGVMQVFLFCGITITAIGMVIGVVTGCLSAIYLENLHRFLEQHFGIDLFPIKVYQLDRVPYDLDPWWIAQVCGLALGVGALVSAIPALRAAWHDPLVSLRGI